MQLTNLLIEAMVGTALAEALGETLNAIMFDKRRLCPRTIRGD